jgi:hypothetical protein
MTMTCGLFPKSPGENAARFCLSRERHRTHRVRECDPCRPRAYAPAALIHKVTQPLLSVGAYQLLHQLFLLPAHHRRNHQITHLYRILGPQDMLPTQYRHQHRLLRPLRLFRANDGNRGTLGSSPHSPSHFSMHSLSRSSLLSTNDLSRRCWRYSAHASRYHC